MYKVKRSAQIEFDLRDGEQQVKKDQIKYLSCSECNSYCCEWAQPVSSNTILDNPVSVFIWLSRTVYVYNYSISILNFSWWFLLFWKSKRMIIGNTSFRGWERLVQRKYGNNRYFSFQCTHPKKLVFLPWAGVEPTSPWPLVGRANHHAGNIAGIDEIVLLVVWGSLGPNIFFTWARLKPP